MSELSHWLGLLSLSRYSNQSFASAIYEDIQTNSVIFTNFPGFRREVLDPHQSRWSRSLHQDPKERTWNVSPSGRISLVDSEHAQQWWQRLQRQAFKMQGRVVILQSNYFKVFLFTYIVVLQIGVSVIHTYQIKENYIWRLLNTNSDKFRLIL